MWRLDSLDTQEYTGFFAVKIGQGLAELLRSESYPSQMGGVVNPNFFLENGSHTDI